MTAGLGVVSGGQVCAAGQAEHRSTVLISTVEAFCLLVVCRALGYTSLESGGEVWARDRHWKSPVQVSEL